uniref:Uncharacterized protein n=1 Tax=Onchocerca volvulus TaxID=6282 RepID=A0A8R1XLG3_ONCVO
MRWQERTLKRSVSPLVLGIIWASDKYTPNTYETAWYINTEYDLLFALMVLECWNIFLNDESFHFCFCVLKLEEFLLNQMYTCLSNSCVSSI